MATPIQKNLLRRQYGHQTDRAVRITPLPSYIRAHFLAPAVGEGPWFLSGTLSLRLAMTVPPTAHASFDQ